MVRERNIDGDVGIVGSTSSQPEATEPSHSRGEKITGHLHFAAVVGGVVLLAAAEDPSLKAVGATIATAEILSPVYKDKLKEIRSGVSSRVRKSKDK